MKELIDDIGNLYQRISKTLVLLAPAKRKKEIAQLEAKTAQPDFWQDREKASQISQKLADLKEEVADWEKLSREADELLEIAKLDQDDKSVTLRKDIEKKLKQLEKRFAKLELQVFLGGKYDKNNVIFSIHAGAGGTDAQDWAEMLMRMYLRYIEKRGWKAKIIDQSRGGEAGIKSASLYIKGRYAYGYLKAEAGVHRLVRISPFDAEKMRHTSFALVEVLPELEEVDVKINPDDLRIDTFLASGHGGQAVQKTESAVRIVHLPTKISVACQSERSQKQNKETALKILKSKLARYFETQQEEEKERIRGQFREAAWGNQIRSYVLHPYKMVKDHRTEYETSDVQSILDGQLDEVIESYLRFHTNILTS